MHRSHALHIFMGRYLLFNVGAFLGGSCAALLVPAYARDDVSFITIGYVLLMVIIVALAVMIYIPQPEKRGTSLRPDVCEEGAGQNPAKRTEHERQIDRETNNPYEAFYNSFNMTPREREIIGYLVHGRSAPFIRDELFISLHTVNTHIKHIYAKTAVNKRQELFDLMEGYRR